MHVCVYANDSHSNGLTMTARPMSAMSALHRGKGLGGREGGERGRKGIINTQRQRHIQFRANANRKGGGQLGTIKRYSNEVD